MFDRILMNNVENAHLLGWYSKGNLNRVFTVVSYKSMNDKSNCTERSFMKSYVYFQGEKAI